MSGDRDHVALLQWVLPLLGLRWRGFKNVRRQVCRRIDARVRELGLEDLTAYRHRLENDEAERTKLASLCFVTISRFYRDREVFDALRTTLLPALCGDLGPRGSEGVLRIWSAGCASGEEPYTLAMMWHLDLAHRFPNVRHCEIFATDSNDEVLARAKLGAYRSSSLVELPTEWRDRAFLPIDDDTFVVRDEIKQHVTFLDADIRSWLPPTSPIDVVLCRNLAFTYFDEATQRTFLERIEKVMHARSLLVVGAHENLPAPIAFEPLQTRHVYAPKLGGSVGSNVV